MIRFPIDAQLLYTALVQLGIQVLQSGLKLRQSYVWVGKRVLIKVWRFSHAKQYKRRNRETHFLKRRLGRVICDIERLIEENRGREA